MREFSLLSVCFLFSVLTVTCGEIDQSSEIYNTNENRDIFTAIPMSAKSKLEDPNLKTTSEPKTPEPTLDTVTILPGYITKHWPNTNFSVHSISYQDVIAGAEPRVGIQAINDPVFISADKNPNHMDDLESVLSVEINGQNKAYPISLLMFHEIVNDTIGGVPIIATYCPLCDSGIVFRREVNNMILDFGVTGNLRLSNLIMYDHQTQSWWQQISGEAIVGDLTGVTLESVPSSIVSWKDFRKNYPHGLLLSRDTGFNFPYDKLLYYGYDAPESWPILLKNLPDIRLPSMERVVGLTLDQISVAYPLSYIQRERVLHDTVNGVSFVILFNPDRSSPFPGGKGKERRMLGSIGVFKATLGGKNLTFSLKNGQFRDAKTNSIWNIFGEATQGPMAGEQLTAISHGNYFWFAWAAHKPKTIIRGAIANWPPRLRSP